MGERKQENKAVSESKNPTPFHAEIGPKNFLSDQSIFTPISESVFTPFFNTNQTRTKHEPNTNRIWTNLRHTTLSPRRVHSRASRVSERHYLSNPTHVGSATEGSKLHYHVCGGSCRTIHVYRVSERHYLVAVA